ncbi:ATP-dependent nuclease [Pantoea endophytica]|uniref:ATP-dependent nuclease n=1 Tax=Pantoea endophytica TaxID=92488 RepID=UPI00301A748D
MFIKSLSIVNYKNFERARFNFIKDEVNSIIGENASGKTNVFQAMRLLLDDSLPSNSKFLDKDDFYRGIGEPFGHWIIITIHFDGLSKSEDSQVLANYIINDDGKRTLASDGFYTFIYRPKHKYRQELFSLTSQSDDLFQREIDVIRYQKTNEISRETYEAISFVRTKVDFTDKKVYDSLAGDFSDYKFPDPNEEDSEIIGNKKPNLFSITNEIACTYVKALRNVVADLKYYKTNPLYRLLTLKSKEIDDEKKVVEDVIKINEKITNIPQIQTLSEKISSSLLNTVGSTYSPKIKISSQLPEDFTELVQSLGLIVEDSHNYNGTGRIEDLSLGGANLIYLALKLYEYELTRDSEEHITHFLLIEEPEAHIHNHIQKTLFNNFNFKNTQVFITTHSTQISSVSKISSMNILSRHEGKTDVFHPTNGILEENRISIERYLDAIRSDILFAKSVILVEGDAELILIPDMVKKTLGLSLDEMGITLIKMDGTVFTHIADLFHKNRIRRYCAILTDLDAAFVKDVDDNFSAKYINDLVNAEASGAARKIKLDSHIKGNNYVNAYYSQNTFETELISYDENIDTFEKLINKEYEQEATIKKAIKEIKDANHAIRYKRVLSLANRIGKGWCATKMLDYIDCNNIIPDYIINAIKFSLSDRNLDEIYKKMMDFNLDYFPKEYREDVDSKEKFEDKVQAYKEYYSDSFIKFWEA